MTVLLSMSGFLLLLSAAMASRRHDCPSVPLDRFAREDSAWRENCARLGSADASRWREYVHLHARARSGTSMARVLVLQHMNMPLGNAITHALRGVFRWAMLTDRALFINSTGTEITSGGKIRSQYFDPGAYFIGRDGVDWWLAGPTGDALAARWRAIGMRKVTIGTNGCKLSCNCQLSSVILADSNWTAHRTMALPESADWLVVDMRDNWCLNVQTEGLFTLMRVPVPDPWDRCRLNAFLRPRPAIEALLRTIFDSARSHACDGNASVHAQPILVALQIRTGHADAVDTFATGPERQGGSWAAAEASFQSMSDRLGLTTMASRKRPRGGPLPVFGDASTAPFRTHKTPVPQRSQEGRSLRALKNTYLNPSAFDFRCVRRTEHRSKRTLGPLRSLLSAFGGIKRFVECALITSIHGGELPRFRVSLVGWRPEPAPESVSQLCGGNSAGGCKGPSLFVSTDSASLNQLVTITSEQAVLSAERVGMVGHSLISFQRSASRQLPNGKCASQNESDASTTSEIISTRTVVDWLVLSMADVLFSASAHFMSSYLSTALERSMLTTSHIEYFDGPAKLLCARSGLCATTHFGKGDCTYVQRELARARTMNRNRSAMEQCIAGGSTSAVPYQSSSS